MFVPVLYTFRRCPYAMRARLALASASVTVELREILLRNKPAEMIKASAKATVPVIVTDNGVIDESRDVMDWALGQNDPERWLENADLTLIEECEDKFKNALDRYKYGTRYENTDENEQRRLASAFILKLEQKLDQSPFLSGKELGFTDIAILPFIRQFANVDRQWFNGQNWPNVLNWLTDFLDSDRFAFIMQKFPVWHHDQEPLFFPEPK